MPKKKIGVHDDEVIKEREVYIRHKGIMAINEGNIKD